MTRFVVGVFDAFMAFDPQCFERNLAGRCNEFHG